MRFQLDVFLFACVAYIVLFVCFLNYYHDPGSIQSKRFTVSLHSDRWNKENQQLSVSQILTTQRQSQQDNQHSHTEDRSRNDFMDSPSKRTTNDASEEYRDPIISTHKVNPIHVNDTDAFGACLMIMDDNHFLVEWLAYHYYVMNLRHVIVMIDPDSRTSPIPIFNRWDPYMTIQIVNWTFPNEYAPTPPKQIGTRHAHPANRRLIGRQLKFYETCMREYKVRHHWKSWVMFTDTDEFISINSLVRNDPNHPLYRGTQSVIPSILSIGKIKKKQQIQQPVQHIGNINQQGTSGSDSGSAVGASLVPSISHAGSVVQILKETMTPGELSKQRSRQKDLPHCIPIPRLPICMDVEVSEEMEEKVANAAESGVIFQKKKSDATEKDRSAGLNRNDFLTQRWLYATSKLRAPKNIVNVGAIESKYFETLDLIGKDDGRPHNVAPGKCLWSLKRDESYLQVYHYTGTKEQREFRQDPRGSLLNNVDSNAGDEGPSTSSFLVSRNGGSPPETSCDDPVSADDLLPWLQGFISTMGTKEANRLLEGVGRVESWPPYDVNAFRTIIKSTA